MLSKKILQTDFIARLTIMSDEHFIAQVQEFVLFYARYFKFTEDELQKIELITEEAVLNIIQNTFGEEESGKIDVKIIYRPGKFVLSIEDKGIPLDFSKLETQENSTIGIMLMKNLADEFRFVNLGKEGKRLELVINFPEESISEMLSQDEKNGMAGEKEVQLTDHPVIRLISTSDAEMLARLAYRVYGYTYFSLFYFPEKIREFIENGLLISAVAVNQHNEIVGNLSLLFESAGAKTADSGAAMVDPRYRGQSLFKDMKHFLKNHATQNQMFGIYSEAVTIHPFTQLGNISMGAKETGIMLAYITEKTSFKKINNDQLLEQRQAAVLYYLKTNQEPHRQVFICEKFFPIIKKVYDNSGLKRDVVLVDTSADYPVAVENSLISTIVKPDFNVAVISLSVIGQDAFELVRQQLREFCLNKVDTIYAEMPVDSPGSAVLTSKLTGLGFILSGIVPEYRNGDYIKLQYLNNVRVDPAKIIIASELGKELLAEIMKDYK